jgi:Divergent InlB B-repeat domain/IPT/TIG domain
VPGSSGTASNYSCTISGTGSSVSGYGNQLAVTVAVTFSTYFLGLKNEYLIAYDNEGLNTTWQQMGTWTVAASQQYSLTTTVSPSGAGGTTPSCPSGCLYTSGTQVQITATPAAGYQFSSFTGVDSSNSSVGYVTMNSNRSVTANFSASPPNITGISPTSGAVGTPVTITGTGFGTSGTVSFNGTPASIVTWTATSIVAQVPGGATTGTITVSTGGYQTGDQQQFQVTAISVAVSPTSATPGQGQTQQFTATVAGTSNQQVTWSVSPTGAWNISSTGLFTAPNTIAAQQVVTVTATSVAQQTATGSATVTMNPPTPTINSQQSQPPGLSLAQGPPQMGFVISGSNFGSVQGSVWLTGLSGGDKALTVVNWSSNNITVQLPAATALGTGLIYVKTSGNVASNQVAFTVSQAFGCNF